MADSSESFELGTRGQALSESTPPNAATSISFELRPVTRQRQVLVLLSSFLTIFIVVGFNQSYGVFQGYYTSDKQSMLPPSAKNNGALLAFVGTLGSGLTWGGSVFVNPLLMRVEGKTLLGLEGRKWITTTGVLLISLGFGLASLSTEIWHLLLTQGLLYGIGSSMIYFPILSIAPEYFDARRGSAMGFILSGTGVGGLTFSPSFQALLNRFGPRSTLLGFFTDDRHISISLLLGKQHSYLASVLLSFPLPVSYCQVSFSLNSASFWAIPLHFQLSSLLFRTALLLQLKP
jgi:hypothetical protein